MAALQLVPAPVAAPVNGMPANSPALVLAKVPALRAVAPVEEMSTLAKPISRKRGLPFGVPSFE